MRTLLRIAGLIGLLLTPAVEALAQPDVGEVIVTARRRDADDFDERIPQIGLKRTADFAVQQVTIRGDTRDAARRNDEIFATVKNAIERAQKDGAIQLATGEMVVEPLTLQNYRNLDVANDGRPDTGRVGFLVKVKLGGSNDAKAALDRIAAFIKSVPTVGRAEFVTSDDLTLSVVAPEQYRGQILALAAADAKATAALMGTDYGVQARGLDKPVEWSRASLTEVFLYVPYQYDVVPRAR